MVLRVEYGKAQAALGGGGGGGGGGGYQGGYQHHQQQQQGGYGGQQAADPYAGYYQVSLLLSPSIHFSTSIDMFSRVALVGAIHGGDVFWRELIK